MFNIPMLHDNFMVIFHGNYAIIFTLFLAVVYSQNLTTTVAPTTTPAPLNCTNIPNVPTHPQDLVIDALIASANENIKVCNQIIPCKCVFYFRFDILP